MELKHERLLSLIQFVQESARLKISPVNNVEKHPLCEYEHCIQGLPGIHFNNGNEEDEIWLTIERLPETAPPEPKNPLIKLWIDPSKSPTKEPSLRLAIERSKLQNTDLLEYYDNKTLITEDTKEGMIFLEAEKKSEVELHFNAYLTTEWIPWAAEEKKRRQSIDLYNRLFRIKQELEGCIGDSQTEFVWGIGIAIWRMNGTKVIHPLITIQADISIDTTTMAIEIRPREVEEQLELDIFNADNNPGTLKLETEFKTFIANRTQSLSSFDRKTFEIILRTAATALDSNGIYWPEQTTADDRSLPTASEALQVTDTWVLIARPRNKSLLIQDLDRFKVSLEDKTPPQLPKAISTILMEPANFREEIFLPSFRGISMVNGSGETDSNNRKIKELYFPKPFNDEQAQIIQLLEHYDGVVVQGPPGTGKTHTIANIIAHYLAEGKRVLVTSMKEPALEVLQEQLPENIRPLAISLLINDQQGMKQFEYSIGKIASEINGINRPVYKKEILQLEQKIHVLHGTLAQIDREVFDWAKKNLSTLSIDQEILLPIAAAKEVLEGVGQYEWLQDDLSLENIPLFNDTDIARLREARKTVGKDIDYLRVKLPEIISLPNSQELITIHKKLSHYKELEQSICSGELPPLIDSSEKSVEETYMLLGGLENLITLKRQTSCIENKWTEKAKDLLKTSSTSLSPIIEMFDVVGENLLQALKQSEIFLSKPVIAPSGIELDVEVMRAIQNKAEGKSSFGIFGWIGKGKTVKKLSEICILTSIPENEEDWNFVHTYLNLQLQFRQLITQWNSLAPKLSLPYFENKEPINGEIAANYFSKHKILRKQIELENDIITRTNQLIPCWKKDQKIEIEESFFNELRQLLINHRNRHDLNNIPIQKEKFLNNLSPFKGDIVNKLITFSETCLGNPNISADEIQARWSDLMAELKRLHEIQGAFAEIDEICHRIAKSGAKKWAQNLETVALDGTMDHFIPNNWKEAWRLKRLATYLEKADPKKQLKSLNQQRTETEIILAHTYQEIIAKRTWLKLAENATPNVRSALEAFLTAISKIGKGTGKRSTRYRQDVRKAANIANNAVPCWIMPHWRVSESLPAQLGCFDLVIIDEASQSDLSALPALLRAQKILIVGDDKQVSPEGIGIEEEKIQVLMKRFLGNHIEMFRSQMTPERSIYDLFKVAFAESSVMLKEHFRCVDPIIEYSKREVYNHELKPLRRPKASERLDPPLIDVLVEDGSRVNNEKLNFAEAKFIVDEIKKISTDPNLHHRTIGVVSLLGELQALKIWEMIEKELSPKEIYRHKIACGDAKTFQGKERDIIFLSMVVSPGQAQAQTKDSVAQRFNVAASRARDRMYLVRSVEVEELSPNDKLRRQLISHFNLPYAQNEQQVEDLRMLCESDFEREIYDILTDRGYRVTPQIKVGAYRIDMVVEGDNDNSLAIECDGDQYHGIERWEEDMNRQRILERVGWRFWRCFASTFVKNRHDVIKDLENTLSENDITPTKKNVKSQKSLQTEHRRINVFNEIQKVN